MANLAGCKRLTVYQHITMMANRYEIRSVSANGPKPLLAEAQEKRMVFHEQVTFYADEPAPNLCPFQGKEADRPRGHL